VLSDEELDDSALSPDPEIAAEAFEKSGVSTPNRSRTMLSGFDEEKEVAADPAPIDEADIDILEDLPPLTLKKTVSSYAVAEPLNIVTVSNGEIVPNSDGINLLKDLTSTTKVISIVGPKRTGKSFLLNRLAYC
jgi:hypothetical protein